MQTITDHVKRAQERLVYRFRKPKILATVASYAAEVQELEDALAALRLMRDVATATGVYLDKLGKLVGQERQGRSDASYRVWIAARAMANRSSGTTEQVIAIVKKLVGTARVVARDEGPRAFTVYIEDAIDEAVGLEIAKIVRVARAVGVYGVVQWFRNPNVFRYADVADDSEDVVPHGFNNGEYAAASDGSSREVTWEVP